MKENGLAMKTMPRALARLILTFGEKEFNRWMLLFDNLFLESIGFSVDKEYVQYRLEIRLSERTRPMKKEMCAQLN